MVRKKETHLTVHSSPGEDTDNVVSPAISLQAGKHSPDVSGGPEGVVLSLKVSDCRRPALP